MTLDLQKLAHNLLGIIKAAAPLVGLADEAEAAEEIYQKLEETVDTIKGAMTQEDQKALQGGLEELRAKINARVKAVTDRL